MSAQPSVRQSLLDLADRPTAYVEKDGVCLLSPFPLAENGHLDVPTKARLSELITGFSAEKIPYYSTGGKFTIKIDLKSDIIASLPRMPPRVSQSLEQSAVDALMDIGNNAETKGLDRKLSLHGEYSRTMKEFDGLIAREDAEQAVSRVLDSSRLAARIDDKSAREAAAGIIDSVRQNRNDGLMRPADAEVTAVGAELRRIKTALAVEFDNLIGEVNHAMAAAYHDKFGSARDEIEPQYREAYDKAVSLLREAGQHSRLFIPPRMLLDPQGQVAIELRHHAMITAMRTGGFQSRLDVSSNDPRLAALLKRRGSALYLRLSDIKGLSSWHVRELVKLRATALAEVARHQQDKAALAS